MLTDLVDVGTGTAAFTAGQVFNFEGGKGPGGATIGAAQFTVAAGTTLNDLTTFFQQRLGINTTVPDDGNPLTAIPGVTVETNPANAAAEARIVFAGNLGTQNQLTLSADSFVEDGGTQTTPFTFATGTNNAGVADAPSGESIQTGAVVYDSLGTPILVNLTLVLESITPAGGTNWRFYAEAANDLSPAVQDLVIGTGTVQFDSLGQFQGASNATMTVSRVGTGAATPLSVDLDLAGLTSFTSQRSAITMRADGSAIGTLESFSIGGTGLIEGFFSNGARRALGQIAIASFANPQGLIDKGGNLFTEGPNSGTAIIGTPGDFGTGQIVAGALELSNVDLSEEFINLIISSTGFSAASRVISTSDQLIQELLNTSR